MTHTVENLILGTVHFFMGKVAGGIRGSAIGKLYIPPSYEF